MWKLVESGGVEGQFLAKTKSTEYFDKYPDSQKIESMKSYLRNVGISVC